MKKIFLLIIVFIAFLSPTKTRASVEIPFGGMFIYSLDEEVCDCSFTNVHYILDYKTNTELALYYSEASSRLYSGYNAWGTYQLGTYIPGAEPCLQYQGEECFLIDTPVGTYGTAIGTGTTVSLEKPKLLQDIFPDLFDLMQNTS